MNYQPTGKPIAKPETPTGSGLSIDDPMWQELGDAIRADRDASMTEPSPCTDCGAKGVLKESPKGWCVYAHERGKDSGPLCCMTECVSSAEEAINRWAKLHQVAKPI